MTWKQVTAVCLLAICLYATSVDAQCTFPSDLDGEFETSHENYPQVWNSTHVYPFEVDTQSLQFYNLTFECSFTNDTYYIARTSISIYFVPYYVYSCWEFEKKSRNRYLQYQASARLPTAADRNYHILPVAYPVTSTLLCNNPAPYSGDYISILVKKGKVASSKTSCPSSMTGKYTYQLTDTTGSTYCDYNSYLEVCGSTVSFNTTLCTSPAFYSTGGTLYCMYWMKDTSANDTYYVYLYNDDASVDYTTTYRFTCAMIYTSGNVTYMTEHPNTCLDSASQNGTYISTAPGGMYSMYSNGTCPPTAESTSYLAIIIAVVVVLLVLIIAGLIGGYIYYKKVYLPKKRDGRSSKVSPDTIPGSGMTADKNYRMMFTPAPPKSAVPERNRGRAVGQERDAASRAESAATLRPTISALATYRTPSPYISDGKDIDVDSLLDYDYPTKQNLGDPDGEESGVMLDMEGSIPVYSEPGDTPEPTRMTPVGNTATGRRN